jgi:hypothetical protein
LILGSRSKGRYFGIREAKYPLFLLGLVVIIAGGLSAQHFAMPLFVDVATVVVGFVLLFLGIVLE